MSSKDEDRKSVVLVRYENGTEKILPKNAYMKMKESGKRMKIVLRAREVRR